MSDSDEESNGTGGEFQEPQKGTRGKSHNSTHKGSDRNLSDISHFHLATSHNGCLPLLKKRRSGGEKNVFFLSLLCECAFLQMLMYFFLFINYVFSMLRGIYVIAVLLALPLKPFKS